MIDRELVERAKRRLPATRTESTHSRLRVVVEGPAPVNPLQSRLDRLEALAACQQIDGSRQPGGFSKYMRHAR